LSDFTMTVAVSTNSTHSCHVLRFVLYQSPQPSATAQRAHMYV
jgi:hypothetical protein